MHKVCSVTHRQKMTSQTFSKVNFGSPEVVGSALAACRRAAPHTSLWGTRPSPASQSRGLASASTAPPHPTVTARALCFEVGSAHPAHSLLISVSASDQTGVVVWEPIPGNGKERDKQLLSSTALLFCRYALLLSPWLPNCSTLPVGISTEQCQQMRAELSAHFSEPSRSG